MRDVVRRLVERRRPQLVMTASAGDQQMTHATALRGCLPCRRADAGLPSHGLRPAQRQEETEGALLRSAPEQRGGHKIILPGLAVLSPRTCRGSAAGLATSDVEPLLPAVGVKRRCSGEREERVRLSHSDKFWWACQDLGSELVRTNDAFYQLLCSAGSVPGRSSGLLVSLDS
jgi:hypothetical protein